MYFIKQKRQYSLIQTIPMNGYKNQKILEDVEQTETGVPQRKPNIHLNTGKDAQPYQKNLEDSN